MASPLSSAATTTDGLAATLPRRRLQHSRARLRGRLANECLYSSVNRCSRPTPPRRSRGVVSVAPANAATAIMVVAVSRRGDADRLRPPRVTESTPVRLAATTTDGLAATLPRRRLQHLR